MIIKILKFIFKLFLTIGLVWIGGYLLLAAQRPWRINKTAELHPAITYTRLPRSEPRKHLIHVAEVDLTYEGLAFVLTPADPDSEHDTFAQKTSTFAEENALALAINTSYFYPFHVNGPIDFYPYEGDPVDALGESVVNGVAFKDDAVPQGFMSFCQSDELITILDDCPEGTHNVVSGSEMMVWNGENVGNNGNWVAPRTAIGLNADSTTMWFVVVDGRQRFYSDGVTMRELADILIELGADRALNFDGGGSSTMVVGGDNGRYSILNAPYHTRVPMRERPVAAHLGIRFK